MRITNVLLSLYGGRLARVSPSVSGIFYYAIRKAPSYLRA